MGSVIATSDSAGVRTPPEIYSYDPLYRLTGVNARMARSFSRDTIDGVAIGMSRRAVIETLKAEGVQEVVSQPSLVARSGRKLTKDPGPAESWIALDDSRIDWLIRQRDAWRYQIPGSYSTVVLESSDDRLTTIRFTWRPFEG